MVNEFCAVGASFLLAIPRAPISSSSAWLLVGVFPVLAVVPLFPVPLAVWSARPAETNPDTDRTLAALTPALAEKVTVIESPLIRAVVTGAEKIIVRIVLEFATLRSCVYVFDLTSETLTVGLVVEVVTVTMMVFPTGTAAVAPILSVVLAVLLMAVPMLVGVPIAAYADVTPRSMSEKTARVSVVHFFMSDLSKGVKVFAK